MGIFRKLLDLREGELLLGQEVIHCFGVLRRDVIYLREVLLLTRL